MDELTKISNGTTLIEPEQGIAAVPLIDQYVGTLSDESRTPHDVEILRSTDLAMLKLYYPPANFEKAVEGGAHALPKHTVDLEAAIIALIFRLSKSEKPPPEAIRNLVNRLRRDMHWYNNYPDRPEIWEHCALHERRLFLPGDGPVDTATYTKFLLALPTNDAITYRVVRDTYPRIEADILKNLQALEGNSHIRSEEFFPNWSQLRRLLDSHFSDDTENPRSVSEKDIEKYRVWRHRLLDSPHHRAFKQWMLQDTTFKERRDMGEALAEELLQEKSIGKGAQQIQRWGLTPEDVITSLPGVQKDMPENAALFLETYRSAMGDPLCSERVATSRVKGMEPTTRRNFQRNAQAAFLIALRHIKDVETNEHTEDLDYRKIADVLTDLAEQAAIEELDRIPDDGPDLASWGERAALTLALSVPPKENTDEALKERFDHAKTTWKKIIVDGVQQPGGKRIPGLLEIAKQRRPARLCRELKIEHAEKKAAVTPDSPLVKDREDKERGEFLSAFLSAQVGTRVPGEVILSWGFPYDDVAHAPSASKE